MEQIDQAFQNIPYLFSLNRKKTQFPHNFQIPNFRMSPLLSKNLLNLQIEHSNDQSIVSNTNKSIQVSKLLNDINNKPSFIRLALSKKFFF